MKKILRALALALAVTVPSAAARADEPIVIKFSHVVAAETPKGQAIEFFKHEVEEKSGGRIKVEVYPNSQLYKDKEELEALQLGSVQMLAPSLGKFGPLGIKEFDLFNLPFLFDDQVAVERVTSGPIGQTLLAKLEPRGIKGLGFWNSDLYVMTANRPLRLPEDFKGLRMRVQSSKVQNAEIRALGAMPQTMAFSEVYQAMQTGVIDGADYPGLNNLFTQKIYEVQKYVTLSGHSYLGYGVIMNKKFWDGLAPDLRQVITQAVADATAKNNTLVREESERALKAMEASGKTTFITLTEAERAAWKKLMVPVHEEFASQIGTELLRQTYEAVQAR